MLTLRSCRAIVFIRSCATGLYIVLTAAFLVGVLAVHGMKCEMRKKRNEVVGFNRMSPPNKRSCGLNDLLCATQFMIENVSLIYLFDSIIMLCIF